MPKKKIRKKGKKEKIIKVEEKKTVAEKVKDKIKKCLFCGFDLTKIKDLEIGTEYFCKNCGRKYSRMI